jgi:mannose-6-phosphate isomerase-like protein (cupin superfamily)
MGDDDATTRTPVVLGPGAGRTYDLGRGQAVFKADGDETDCRYSISEWWLEPHTAGPGAHQHPEDDVFYVVEGTITMVVGDRRFDAAKGSFVLVPGGTLHDFENRTDARAGFLNVSSPGEFEPEMPGIAEWFRTRSETDARPRP